MLSTTSLILLLTGFIITILLLYQRRQKAYKQHTEEITQSHEKHLLEVQLEIQEQTVLEVSREIHDNIALGLSLSKLHLNTLDANTARHEKIRLSVELIGTAIENLRNLCRNFNADIVRKYGLLRGLENEVESIRKTGVFSVQYVVAGTPMFLDSMTELVIFRIIQEAINNIIKHANARHIFIGVDYIFPELFVRVRDDGVGFMLPEKDSSLLATLGSGLNNIRERARMIFSRCEIKSFPGTGTTIILAVPIPNQKSSHG